MSARIKLYIINPADKKLYFCRFPASLDISVASARGWTSPHIMQRRFKTDIKSLAIEHHIRPGDLKESPHPSAQLTKELLDEHVQSNSGDVSK